MPKRQNRNTLSFTALALLLFLFALKVCGANETSFTPGVMTMAVNSNGSDIQKALDQLPSGGEVVLPAGIYEIHQPLILQHDNQTLRGSGEGTVLLLAAKANCPVIILGAALVAPRRLTTHLRLADLVIDGNRKNQQVEFWHNAIDGSQLNNNGIDAWGVNDVTIERVTCCRCRSGGLVTAETRHLNVSGFTAFDNQFDGLACYQTEESHFTGLRLHDNLAAGISLDLAFNHNVISDADLTGNDVGVFMRASRDNSFQSVIISKSRKHGIFMAQTIAGTPHGWMLSPGTECTGNDFDGLMVSDCGGDAFLVNNASCTNNIIHDAKFLDNTLGGFATGDGHSHIISLAMADSPAPASEPALAHPRQTTLVRQIAKPPTSDLNLQVSLKAQPVSVSPTLP